MDTDRSGSDVSLTGRWIAAFVAWRHGLLVDAGKRRDEWDERRTDCTALLASQQWHPPGKEM
jgi:hypothetical protein